VALHKELLEQLVVQDLAVVVVLGVIRQPLVLVVLVLNLLEAVVVAVVPLMDLTPVLAVLAVQD
jgi:hypothetical protein